MDKDLGKHLSFIYREYADLSRELREMREELRDAKRQIESLSSKPKNTAKIVQTKECKKVNLYTKDTVI